MTSSSFPFFRTAAPLTMASLLAWEQEYGFSRESVTLAASASGPLEVPLGTVYGRRLFGAVAVAALVGNAGNGTLTSVVLGDGAKAGVYRLTALDATLFEVVDPDGYRLADATAGAYASPQIGFTVTAGGTAFVPGDGFTLTVAEGDRLVVPLDPDATDGTQLAAGVLLEAVSAPEGATPRAMGLRRDGIVRDKGLVWPEGLTEPERAAAIQRLDGLRITVVPAL